MKNRLKVNEKDQWWLKGKTEILLEALRATKFDLVSPNNGMRVFPHCEVSVRRMRNIRHLPNYFDITPSTALPVYESPKGITIVPTSYHDYTSLTFLGSNEEGIFSIGRGRNPPNLEYTISVQNPWPSRSNKMDFNFRLVVPSGRIVAPEIASAKKDELGQLGLSTRARRNLRRVGLTELSDLRQLHEWGIDYSKYVILLALKGKASMRGANPDFSHNLLLSQSG